MTEKRFKIDNKISLENKIKTSELSTLVDTKTKNFYFIVDSLSNVDNFCNRLNELAEEKERLKEENAELLNSIVSLRATNDELRGIDGDYE